MKRRAFALALACALSLALLSSCGGNNGGGSSVSGGGSSSSQDGSDLSSPGSSLPDASLPDGSQSSGSASSSQQPDVSQPEQTGLTLNRTEFALFTAGSTFSTLSMVIYSMAKKRVSPEINALSTLLFVVVVTLLVIVNVRQTRQDKRRMVHGN